MLVFSWHFITEKILTNENSINDINYPFVSIIVAVRNEQNNIIFFVQSVLNQKYKGDFELIIINDHSEDDSLVFLNKFKTNNIKINNLPQGKKGKKDSLSFGAELAKADILAFTDGDCILPPFWLSIMLKTFVQGNYTILCGPVEFYDDKKSIFSDLLKLEFLSLTGLGAAGFFLKKPYMCNGANYIIEKKVFLKYSSAMRKEFSSGDDVFLLHTLKKYYKVGFCHSQDAIVKTKAPSNFNEFLYQRLRWASKTKGYKDFFAIYVSLSVFFMSLITFISIIGVFYANYNFVYQWVLILKFFVDFFLLLAITDFYKKRKLCLNFLLLEFFHPLYLIGIGISSILVKPKWKGRKIKS